MVDPAQIRARIALFVYLSLLAIAEFAVTFINPLLVFPLHGGLIALIGLYVARIWRSEHHTELESALVVVLTLGPLIRIISLTLPLGEIEPPFRYVAAGVPMALGGLLAARAAGLRASSVGLRWSGAGWQLLVVLLAVPIGFAEYVLLQNAPLGDLPWQAGSLLPAMAVGLFTGFPEELIFRGLMQTMTRPFLGRWNWVFVAAVFAVLHIGYRNFLDILFVFGVGLIFGWVFERTRSIIGISVSHGLANVILFFVAPNLLDPASLPTFGPSIQLAAGIGTIVAVSAAGFWISRQWVAGAQRPPRGRPHSGPASTAPAAGREG